mgnify:CR=1 FL=1
MTIAEAMKLRHSVRTYQDKPIPAQICSELEQEIAACNAEGGLRIQLVTNEKDAFDGFMAHYGKFSGVRNYIALIGWNPGNNREFFTLPELMEPSRWRGSPSPPRSSTSRSCAG